MQTFGNQQFKTKALAKKFWSKWIIENLGQTIFADHTDFAMCCDLLKNHPQHKTATPEYFTVRCNQYGNPELRFYIGPKFHIFSISSAVSGRSKSHEQLIVTAMRRAVSTQIASAKLQQGTCEWCKQELTGDLHVDHVIPFNEIAKDFIALWKGDIPDEVASNEMRGGPAFFHAKDAMFERAWRDYHRGTAQMRTVHAECNLERGRSKDISRQPNGSPRPS